MGATAVSLAFTGVQKCAILLVVLGDQISGELLKRLSDDEVQLVSNAVASLPVVSQEQVEAVIEEFRAETRDAVHLGHGGVDYAKRILTAAFGAEGSKKHMERLPKPAGKTSNVNQELQRVDPQLLARFVRSEHPQTVALILSHLNPSQSAAVLASMDPEMRADLAVRIAQLDQISPVVIGKISAVLGKKLKTLGEIKRESYGGPRVVAEIFNQLESGVSKEILTQIGEQNSELMESIRRKMFVFEDLMAVDANGVKEVLSRVDRRLLSLALKGTSEELRTHLLQGMSQRGAAMLIEDMEALGPVKIKDVQAAQQEVIEALRKLESEGVISLRGGSDEQFVV
jgi:flagellar motor switch protein FliG